MNQLFNAFAAVDPRQLRLVGYGSFALLIAALVTLLILPQWKLYQATSSSLHIIRTNIAAGEELAPQLEALESEVMLMERQLNGDASNLPAKQMEAFVIGRLQTISWRNKLKLVGVQPSEGQMIDQFRELIFDVELSGQYFPLFNWLSDISEELGFVVVKRFDIQSDNRNGSDKDSELKVKLSMAAYRSEE